MPIGLLKAHPRNPREHPKPGSTLWEVMRRSLDAGYFDPVVWNERNGLLVSGHLRVKVMTELGFTLVDVSSVELDEVEHYARMIAANRVLGQWEDTILASLAADIEAAGLDAALAGFDHKALLALLDPPEITDDTENAEDLVTKAELLQREWQVQPGDLYQLGGHRLICGDCTAPDNWQRLLNGGLADMAWWDPPYNVAYKQDKAGSAAPVTILNDDMAPRKYARILTAWLRAGVAHLKPGAACYIAHAESYGLETRVAARRAGLKVAQCLIWAKTAWTLGMQDYQWQHEPVLYGWKLGGGHHWQGGFSNSTLIDDARELKKLSKAELIALVNHMRNASDTTVIREPRPRANDLHPTMKPVRLVARHVWNSSRRGETVLEMFLGSGTTMLAAEQIGRRCVAMELDPKFCAVSLQRAKLHGLEITKLHGPS